MHDENEASSATAEAAVNDAIEAVRQAMMRHPICPGCGVALLMFALDAMLKSGVIGHTKDPEEVETPRARRRRMH